MQPYPLYFLFEFKTFSTFVFTGIFFLFFSLTLSLAEAPPSFDLSNGDYYFTEWSAAEPAGTYPPNMIFMQSGSRDPELSDDFDLPWPCTYNLTSKSRINGLGENGIAFYNTSTSQDECSGKYIGAAVLSLKTTGRTYITVNWLAETLAFAENEGNPRENRIRLQYRIDTNSAFVDVENEMGNPVEYDFNKSMPNIQNISAVLPWDAENRDLVQLRWVYYLYKEGSGTRVRLRLDEINISSESPADEAPKKLEITATEPHTTMQNAPFRLVIRTTNEEGIPKNVSQNTDIRLTLKNGNGELSGTVIGTIPAGNNTLLLNEVIYNESGSAVLKAEVSSGETLDTDTEKIEFLEGPVSLTASEFYNKNHISMPLQEFKVSALDEKGNPVNEFTGYKINLKKLSGPGNMQGTSTQKAINGVAVFDNISFDAPGTYKFAASIAGLPDSEVQTVFVKNMPEMTELKIPLYIKGEGDFGTRVPAFALVELNNLHPNTIYRYSTGARDTGYHWPGYDPQYDPGAGNNFQYDERTGEYTYNLGNDISADGEYSVIVTGEAETSKRIWLNIVSTRNSTFAEGNEVYWILHLGNEVGELLNRYPTENTSKALDFGTSSADATGIFDRDSWLPDKNFLLLYEDIDGLSMPLSGAIVQSDGQLFRNIDEEGNPYPNQGPPWYEMLDDKSGSWATILPNTGAEGESVSMNRIEEYSSDGELLRVWTDDDETWAGVSTNNPRGGIDDAIDFETPQIELLSPKAENEICNSGKILLQFRSHGVAEFDVFLSQGSAPFELFKSSLPVKKNADGITNFELEIPYGKYDLIPTSLKIASSEHPDISDDSKTFTIFDKPLITKLPESSVKCEGDAVELSTIAIGTNISYQWQRNGEDIPGANKAIFRIEDLYFDHSSIYRCVVSGGPVCESAITDDVVIYVAGETEITHHPREVFAFEGGRASFEIDAHVNGIPDDYDIYVQWFRGDSLLNDNERYSGTNSNIMTIRDIRGSDFGNDYNARVYGLCGDSAVSSDINLLELKIDNPEILFEPDCRWASNTLTTNASTKHGTLEFRWYKDGELLQDGADFQGTQTNELKILRVDSVDLGKYNVEITVQPYGVIYDTEPVEVTILGLAEWVYHSDLYVEVNEGESFRLEAEAENYLPINYMWYRNWKKIDNADTNVYIVDSAKAVHAGIYECWAWTRCGGHASSQFTVVVYTDGITGLTEDDAGPAGFMLSEPRPNPLRNSAYILFSTPSETYATITLYDLYGNEISTLFGGIASAGEHKLSIDAEKLNLASGTYYYILRAGNAVITKTMIIVK